MKSIIITITALLGIAFIALNGCDNNGVSQQEFQEAHTYLNERIDTMQVKLDSVQWLISQLNVKVDTIGERQVRMYDKIIIIERDIDTLKIGQIIIYDEVAGTGNETESKRNWANKLIDWLQ